MKKLLFTFLMICFGYGLLFSQIIGNNAEGTLYGTNSDAMAAIKYQCTQNMTVTKMYAKIYQSGTGYIKCAIYTDNGSGDPGTFLMGTNELTNPGTGWKSFDLTSELALTSGTYYHLVFWSNYSGFKLHYSSVSGIITNYKFQTYGSWPSTYGTPSGGGTGSPTCMYAEAPGIIGNNAEGTLFGTNSDAMAAIRYQCTQNMTVTKMYAKIYQSGTGYIKCAIYSDNASGDPETLLRGTNELTNPGTGWKTFDLTSGLALTAGTWYHLVYWSNNTGFKVNYSSVAGIITNYKFQTYGSWPSPFGTPSGGGTGTPFCIYADGSASCTNPSITDQPDNLTLNVGQSATFTVAASGTSLTYQWKKNTVNISGATSTSYNIPSVATGDAGNYTVVVSGACGSPVTSSTAVLTVNSCTNPAITSQPQSSGATVGVSKTFTVTATGTSLTYQWKKNGSNISGATSSSYTISSPVLSNSGNYTVVVSGACGSPVTSNTAVLTVANYWVATNGNDNNAGTYTAPYATWHKGFTMVTAGQTLCIRGGTYLPAGISGDGRYSGTYINNKDGSSGSIITVLNYPGETPIMDCRNLTQATTHFGIYLYGCAYWVLKGLTITRADQHVHVGITYYGAGGIYLKGCTNITVERCVTHHNGGTGIAAPFESNNILYLNCDSYANADPNSATPYDHADGFAIEVATSTLNSTIRGCRSWYNADDGFDIFENDGYVTFDSCWAWSNGYLYQTTTTAGNGSGIKLGSTADYHTSFKRTVTNCLSFKNRVRGINQNAANCKMYLLNNTVYGNGGKGFDFYGLDLPNVFRNNICFSNSPNWEGAHVNAVIDHNSYDASWQPTGPVADASDFISLDTTGVSSARQANGTLPNINFLKLDLSPLSNLVGAGVAITVPYSIDYTGYHPDLGAFESIDESQSASLVNQPTGNPELVNKDMFAVYPNPVKDRLTIALDDNAQASIKMYDLKGTKLYEGIAAGTTTIDMSSYAPGVYIMHVEIGSELKVAKIIK